MTNLKLPLSQAQPFSDAIKIAEIRQLWKSFGGIPVLRGVDIDLYQGEIHSLVGGNGAGKSTLMKALTGVISPDSGQILINGQEVKNLSPSLAHKNRIYMVPQEPKLFPNLTVMENISLSLEGIGVKKTRILEVCEQIAAHINVRNPAAQLSISDQQLVEIIRGILRDAKVLIVDEPTAALTVKETEILFSHLRSAASRGVGIFYVTHRMQEIFELCNRVTVLRDGIVVSQKATKDTTIAELVSQMIPDTGRLGEEKLQNQDRGQDLEKIVLGDKPSLEVKNLSGEGFAQVSFAVKPGEILAIAGVVGSGRTELAESIYGIRKASGQVVLNAKNYDQRNPATSLSKGLAYVPEDRHLNGVFLLGTIIENVTSSIMGQMSKAGWMRRVLEAQFVQELSERLDLQTGSLQRRVGNLSGGNQQKVSVAKALAVKPQVIILDEPSRGVDVSARADLYKILSSLRKQGCAVVVISSDFEEIAQIATRVLVMRSGHICQEITADAGAKIELKTIRNGCFGVQNPKDFTKQNENQCAGEGK